MLAKDTGARSTSSASSYLQPLLQWIKKYKKKMGKAAFATVDLGFHARDSGRGCPRAGANVHSQRGGTTRGPVPFVVKLHV